MRSDLELKGLMEMINISEDWIPLDTAYEVANQLGRIGQQQQK